MDQAIRNPEKQKKLQISAEEEEAAFIAILLHDAGHGPFSHALENSIITGISHEDLSLLLMNMLNEEFKGRLSLAIDIFNGTYKRRFLHELIAGQMDMDRLDYLRRDSFFTGVIEGSVGSDRIIRMLNVVDDRLVVDEKGIYSTREIPDCTPTYVLAGLHAQNGSLIRKPSGQNTQDGQRSLLRQGHDLYATPALRFFLYNKIGPDDLLKEGKFTPGHCCRKFYQAR